jgi:drug/metabolite transporter (DMT)-like permease
VRALAAAPASLVSPLVHAQPLFTIALAGIFLRDVERLTWRIVVASLLIVAGVTVVLRFT